MYWIRTKCGEEIELDYYRKFSDIAEPFTKACIISLTRNVKSCGRRVFKGLFLASPETIDRVTDPLRGAFVAICEGWAQAVSGLL